MNSVNEKDEKYSKWFFTWETTNEGELIDPINLKLLLQKHTIEYVFQKEQATRVHYQGYFKTLIRTRKTTLLKRFSDHLTHLFSTKNLTLLPGRGSDEQMRAYVSKSETKIGETVYSPGLEPYKRQDLAILENREKWYPWQGTLHSQLFNDNGEILRPDDRTIIFILDKTGNSGKSKYLKYLATKYSSEIMKVPFGTSTQLRSSICLAGPRRLYFFDLTRTLSEEDSMQTLYSLIEDIKNGFVTTSMYGSYKQLLFDPPHIVIFSNKKPLVGALSADRWRLYEINNNKQMDYFNAF